MVRIFKLPKRKLSIKKPWGQNCPSKLIEVKIFPDIEAERAPFHEICLHETLKEPAGELEESRQCLEAKLRNNKNLNKDKHMRKHMKASIVTVLCNSTFYILDDLRLIF